MMGGISVACRNYTQEWAIQAQALLLVLLLLVLDLPRIFVLKLYLVPRQMSSTKIRTIVMISSWLFMVCN